MALASVCIGDPVVVAPGVRIPHGGVVIDGVVDIGEGTSIMPGVTIGRHCSIGANSVVVSDIPDHCVAVGSPARVVRRYDPVSGKWARVEGEKPLRPTEA